MAVFDRVTQGTIDSWAYPWTACVWYYGGLTATPNVNLVSNIGFGPDATHTVADARDLCAMATSKIGELKHPLTVVQDVIADRYTFDRTFGGESLRFPAFLFCFPRKACRALWRRLESLVA